MINNLHFSNYFCTEIQKINKNNKVIIKKCRSKNFTAAFIMLCRCQLFARKSMGVKCIAGLSHSDAKAPTN